MGRGNPRFAQMELYDPETYYLCAYDDDDWESAFQDFTCTIENELDEYEGSMFEFVDAYTSEDVTMCASRECALTIAEHPFCTICISSESDASNIVFGIIPIGLERFVDAVESTTYANFGACIGYPGEWYDEGFYGLEGLVSAKEFDEMEKKLHKCYENYIKTIFNPIKTKVIRKIYSLYKGCVHFPTSAWTSGKLELQDE